MSIVSFKTNLLCHMKYINNIEVLNNLWNHFKKLYNPFHFIQNKDYVGIAKLYICLKFKVKTKAKQT